MSKTLKNNKKIIFFLVCIYCNVTVNAAVKLGEGITIDGLSTVSVGDLSKAIGAGSTAIGYGAESYRIDDGVSATTAVGYRAKATNYAATALGYGATATEWRTIAIGDGSTASGSHSVSFGSFSKAIGANTVVLGVGTKAEHNWAVALGADAVTELAITTNNAKVGNLHLNNFAGQSKAVVSIGHSDMTRQIVNLAAGRISETSTDAINGSQLYSAMQILDNFATSIKTTFGGDVVFSNNGTFTYKNIGGSGTDNINDAIAAAISSNKTIVEKGDGIAVTKATKNSTDIYTVALSDDTTESIKKAHSDIENLQNTKADKTYVDIELAKKADKADLVALEQNITTAIQPALDAKADKTDLDATNDKLNALDSMAVKYDSPMKDAVTFKGATGTTLNNVAAGAVSADSKQAINGSQLHNVVMATANHLGGGSTVLADGTLTAPTYSITDYAQGTTVQHNNVGDALGHLNKNQNALAKDVQALTGAMGNLRSDINRVRREAHAGTAAAMAIANLGQPYKPAQTAFGLSSAIYKGRVGVAAGVSRITENGKFLFKGAVNTNNDGQFGAAVSATYYFD